jgi:DNA-binding GntR family transcriptional regulator
MRSSSPETIWGSSSWRKNSKSAAHRCVKPSSPWKSKARSLSARTRGAIVKPLSAAEILDIAELRLALISLGLKPAYRHLSPADLDHAYDLAKRLTRVNNAKDFFEYNWQFWDSIFSKAQRPVLPEVYRQLEDRMARYYPLLLKLFPTARPSEILMEMYRKGKIAEAFRAFKKIYLGIVAGVIDHLKSQEAGDSSRRLR